MNSLKFGGLNHEKGSRPIIRYHSFMFQAKSWDKLRRVIAKIEFHAEELFAMMVMSEGHMGNVG